ncbi:MAG: GtrA family protein [Paludibacter sp.]
MFKSTGGFITRIIDFFYPPFSRYFSVSLFRYAVIGVSNLVLDWVLYFLVYQFVLHKQMLHLGIVTFSSHIATKFIVFPVTFLTGFLLQKYVTFQASGLHSRIQLLRYFTVVLANLIINYIGLKLLVDYMYFYASIANVVVTVVTVMFSYISQKKYTFKIKKHE